MATARDEDIQHSIESLDTQLSSLEAEVERSLSNGGITSTEYLDRHAELKVQYNKIRSYLEQNHILPQKDYKIHSRLKDIRHILIGNCSLL